MSDTVKIRTTMRPDEEIEVSPAELLDLQRQGLVKDNGPAKKKESASNG